MVQDWLATQKLSTCTHIRLASNLDAHKLETNMLIFSKYCTCTYTIPTPYYMAVSHKDWELPNPRI